MIAILKCLGRSFFGLALTAGRVLWVDAESLGLEEITRRAYQVARGLDLDAPPEGIFYHQVDVLGSERAQEEILNMIERHRIDLCLVDSLSAGSATKDLKEQVDTVALMKALMAWGVPVLAIDHTTKRESRGNMANASVYGSVFKYNCARSVIKLTRADGGGLGLVHDKSNFGPLQETISFAIDFVNGTGTKLHPQRIEFRRLHGSEPELAGAEQHMKAQDAVLHVLRELYEENSPRLSISLDELDKNIEDKSRKTIKNHLTHLVQAGRVRRVDTGYYEPIYVKEAYTAPSLDDVPDMPL